MRFASVAVILVLAAAGHARAQAIILPADADLRAMQAPVDYEGSRAEAYQEQEHIFVGTPRPLISNPLPSNILPSWRPSTSEARTTAAASPAPPVTSARPAVEEFSVEIWDEHDRVVETVARASSLAVARAAYREAAKERPHMKVALRRGETVVASKAGR